MTFSLGGGGGGGGRGGCGVRGWGRGKATAFVTLNKRGGFSTTFVYKDKHG